MRKHLASILCVCLCGDLAVSSQEPASREPVCQDVIQYAFGGFCTAFISQIHEAKSDYEKRHLAQNYYGAIFVMWFVTQNPRVSSPIHFDIENNVRSFLRYSKELEFGNLIVRDDPLNRRNLSPDISSFLTDSFGGSYLFVWVLDNTKDAANYQKDISAFRTFMDHIRDH
jgi:hypothetical protein